MHEFEDEFYQQLTIPATLAQLEKCKIMWHAAEQRQSDLITFVDTFEEVLKHSPEIHHSVGKTLCEAEWQNAEEDTINVDPLAPGGMDLTNLASEVFVDVIYHLTERVQAFDNIMIDVIQEDFESIIDNGNDFSEETRRKQLRMGAVIGHLYKRQMLNHKTILDVVEALIGVDGNNTNDFFISCTIMIMDVIAKTLSETPDGGKEMLKMLLSRLHCVANNPWNSFEVREALQNLRAREEEGWPVRNQIIFQLVSRPDHDRDGSALKQQLSRRRQRNVCKLYESFVGRALGTKLADQSDNSSDEKSPDERGQVPRAMEFVLLSGRTCGIVQTMERAEVKKQISTLIGVLEDRIGVVMPNELDHESN